MNTNANPVKPRLRGVFHELGFYVALGTGFLLVLSAAIGLALGWVGARQPSRSY